MKATTSLWPPLQSAYKLVHQAVHILANPEQHTGPAVRERYLAFVRQMQEQKADVGPLAEAIEHFCHLTENFAAGLFQCYDVKGLPRTNNDLEHCFGVARVHERRATGGHSWGGGAWFGARHYCRGDLGAELLGRGASPQRLSAVARPAGALAPV